MSTLARARPRSSPTKDLETVPRGVRRHEVGDCPGISPRTREECDRPLRDPLVLHMDEAARFGLVEVLSLQHESERLFGAIPGFRKSGRLLVCGERVIVITTV